MSDPYRCAVPSLLVLAFAGQVGAADTTVTIANVRGSSTYEIALDELQATCIAPAALPGQVRSMTPDGKTRLSGIDSLPQLESVASSLRQGAAGRTTVAAVLYPAGGQREPASRAILSRLLALRVKAGTDIGVLAGRHRCRVVEVLASDLAVLEPQDPSLLAGSRAATELAADPAVRSAEVQVHRLVATRYTPIDPEFHPLTGYNPLFMVQWIAGVQEFVAERKQWHLFRAPRGMMLEPVWGSARDVKDGFTGTGIRVATVDTGVDTRHPDLGIYPLGNLQTDLAHNFSSGLEDDVRPKTVVENHGTAIAGVIAEREGKTGLNGLGQAIGVGGVGVAFEATLVPLRFITTRDIGKEIDPLLNNGGPADPDKTDPWPGKTELDFHTVVQYQLNPLGSGKQVHVSCNSWGNTGVSSFSVLGETATSAFLNGVTTGRFSRGLIFVWAAGNDHGLTLPYHPTGMGTDLLPEDNACYDAWLNRYVLPIGALNRGGRKASYSEIGPTLLVCAPGGEYNFSPYEDPYSASGDLTTGPGPNTPPPPAYLMHGLTTTDRSREWLNGNYQADPGYNHGELPDNGDTTKMGSNPVPPTPSENLPQWIFDGAGNPVIWQPDTSPDLVTEEWAGPDLDGDGYMDTGEDLDHDNTLDAFFWFDADSDGHQDFGEDVNNNGLLDAGEDLNGDGLLQRNEDLNGDGVFWPSEDLNSNGLLDVGEDLNGNGLLDFNEDLDHDGHFDFTGTVICAGFATAFTSEGLWALGAGEPDFNHNHIQDSALAVNIFMNDGLGGTLSWFGVIVDEDLNQDGYPDVDPTPTGSVYFQEGIDFYFDRFEDFNHDGAVSRNSDLNSDGIWGGEDSNNDHAWTPGDYSQWAATGYTHPNGPGVDVAGSSFAAANASGVVALMLQARPELTWRDVQLILAHRSRLPGRYAGEGRGYPAGPSRGNQPIAPAFFTASGYAVLRGLRYDMWTPSDITHTIPPSVGYYYNHWYGFGAINALKAIYGCDTSRATLGEVPATRAHGAMVYPGWPVTLADQIANPGALHWPLLPAEEIPLSVSISGPAIVPVADITTGQPRLNADLNMVAPPGVTDFQIETVELHLNITISSRSCLTLGLVSPSGTIAMIPQRVSKDGASIDSGGPTGTANLDYTFTLRNFLGEYPQGVWRIIILNTVGPTGQFNAATITAHGHRPYPVPNAYSTTPGGIAATVGTSFQVNGSQFRRNASAEVTMTKALWIDHFNDTSAESADKTDDLAASIAAGDMVADLQAQYLDDGTMTVQVPAALTAISPGDATILIANPEMPIGQSLPSINFVIPFGFQYHGTPAPHPTAIELEEYYPLDAWTPGFTSVLASDSYLKGVHTTYPAGVDPITGVAYAAGFDCRIKSTGLANALHLKYSRSPTITGISDQLLPASTSVGTPFTVTFIVDDPDINPATVHASRTGNEETVAVTTAVFNQAAVHASSLVLTPIVLGPNGTGTYTLSGITAGTSGLSIIAVNVSDGVTTRTSSFRVGILTDETGTGCGGGMGLALLGGPLAIWLFRRRRR